MAGEQFTIDDGLEALVRNRTADLLRSNERLRAEVERLSREYADTRQQLAEAISGRHTDREIRRAALNLMEDAVAARRAEHREILERRRAEEELRAADRRKDEFLATLAHELRNPLAPITSAIQSLQSRADKDPEMSDLCATIERQANQLVRLVEDLLDVSRITSGKIVLRKEPADLANVIRSAIETSRTTIEARGHELSVSMPPQEMPVEGDSVRLSQVFSNLLNNAAKYTDPGGRIEIEVGLGAGKATVCVRDNGKGLSEELLPRMFDMFTQGDVSANERQGGLGVGLTLVRSLVELHGGHVTATSDGPGKGSLFIVTLPVASSHATPAPAAPVKTPHSRNGGSVAPGRILVVDDNVDAARTMQILLRPMVSAVRTASSGRQALEAIAQECPDLVLLDLGMPEMDGFEVARRIRELPECSDVVLVALTGWGQESDRQRTREAGFDYHLVKPATMADLQGLLTKALPQKDTAGLA